MKRVTIRQLNGNPVTLTYDEAQSAYYQLRTNDWHVLSIRHQAGVTTLSAVLQDEEHHQAAQVPGLWKTNVWFVRVWTADYQRLFKQEDL